MFTNERYCKVLPHFVSALWLWGFTNTLFYSVIVTYVTCKNVKAINPNPMLLITITQSLHCHKDTFSVTEEFWSKVVFLL